MIVIVELLVEFIAVILTLTCVILLNKKMFLGWPIGALAAIAFFITFYYQNLYAQSSLQVIYVAQSLYGWFIWKKDEGEELKVRRINGNLFLNHVYVVLLLAIIISTFLTQYTDAEYPFLDVLTTLLALLANWYLSKKILDSWYLWSVVNILLIILFSLQGLWLSVGLYIILLMISVNAVIEWKKELYSEKI